MKTINLVACYVRVSTENQLENYSIEQQTDRLRAFCKAKDFNIYKFYVDGGYSGGNTNRPALNQLLDDIEKKKLSMVIVYKLDRLSRSQKDTLNLIEDKFMAHNVDFLSVAENFDTSTAFGRAMIGILSVFAQLEKDQITERFTMGRVGRSKSGLYHGGPTPPTGYDYIGGKLIVNEFKAMQVKEVYSKFLSGYSINCIKNHMSEKYGGWNSHSLVLKVLKNSVYIGKVKFGGSEYTGIHKPIISEVEYCKVQELLTGRGQGIYKAPFKTGYLLSGLLSCARCHSRYSANHSFYKCYSRSKSNKKYIKDPHCKNKNWAIDELDTIITSFIVSLKVDSEYAKQLWDYAHKEFWDTQSRTKKRIKELNVQISRLIDLYQLDGLQIETLSEKLALLQKEKSTLEASLNLSSIQTEKPSVPISFNSVFTNGTLQEKQLLVKSIIESIELDGNNITIRWLF